MSCVTTSRRVPSTIPQRSGAEIGPAAWTFIEEMAVAMEAERVPRIAGRIFAFLLICEPPEQSAADLARELHASAGSVSTMTRLLVGTGLIERVSRAGHRADRFRVTAGGLSSLVATGSVRMARFRRISDRGLGALAHRPPAELGRLRELRDLYAFFESRLPALVEEWQHLQSAVGPETAPPVAVDVV